MFTLLTRRRVDSAEATGAVGQYKPIDLQTLPPRRDLARLVDVAADDSGLRRRTDIQAALGQGLDFRALPAAMSASIWRDVFRPGASTVLRQQFVSRIRLQAERFEADLTIPHFKGESRRRARKRWWNRTAFLAFAAIPALTEQGSDVMAVALANAWLDATRREPWLFRKSDASRELNRAWLFAAVNWSLGAHLLRNPASAANAAGIRNDVGEFAHGALEYVRGSTHWCVELFLAFVLAELKVPDHDVLQAGIDAVVRAEGPGGWEPFLDAVRAYKGKI